MTQLYPVIVNILIGSVMLLVGFKVYVPKFKSEEDKSHFYKRYSSLLKIGGGAMVLYGLYGITLLENQL